ncbi:MAG: copper homeostasis protein CutC [Gemmatimonadota bacterium]
MSPSAHPHRVLIEACVDSVRSAQAALEGGADRLELCSGLLEAGVTPSLGLLEAIRTAVALPVFVLIRPRGGDFLYDPHEVAAMIRDIQRAKTAGAAGVVLGALTAKGEVDRSITQRLIDAARPLPVTFHRAFDLTRDPDETLETLMEMSVDRVLTSGQAPTAWDGQALIRAMVEAVDGTPVILAGGGIAAPHVRELVRVTGVTEIHLRGATVTASEMIFRRPGIPLGKPPEGDTYIRAETSADRVRQIVAALNGSGDEPR